MKKLNKLLAIVLAIAMIMSLAVSAGAAGSGTCSIKVTNATNGETYYAYKIFDAVVSTSGNYSYTINNSTSSDANPFYSAIKSATEASGTLASFLTLTTSATDSTVDVVTFTAYDATTMSGTYVDENAYNAAFTSALAAVIKGVLDSASPAISADGTGTASTESGSTYATISGLTAGYYYVNTTVGTVISLGTTSGENAEIEDKNTEPTTTKTVADTADGTYGEESDAGVGDTVYFKTKIDNIYGSSSVTLHDLMDEGLTFGSITSVKLYKSSDDADPATLTSGNSGQGYTLTTTDVYYYAGLGSSLTYADNTYYTYTAGGTPEYSVVSGGSLSSDTEYYVKGTFDMTFDYSGVSGVTSTAYIVVEYTATVNDKAVIYSSSGDPDSNDNETYVSFGNQARSAKDGTQTYVYSVNIFKYSGESVISTAALSGASFYLYKDVSGTTYYAVLTQDSSDTTKYTLGGTVSGDTVYWTINSSDATVFTTGSTGLIQIEGLDAGTYYLHETAAPTGYNPLTSDIMFYIAGKDASTSSQTQGVVYESSLSTTVATQTVTINATDYPSIPIKNSTGSEMPVTGGIGTTIFYIVGGVLVVGAIVLLITKKRIGKDGE